MKPIIKAFLIAAAISFLPFGAQAAGLGQISVQSNLGEPLNAEIQINATQQELQSLSARIAPPDAFLQANIPYAGFVPNVRVTVENRGERSVLKLTSDVPVNEAVASLIVQLNWDDGRVSRTYNILLNPKDLVISPPAPVEPTVVARSEPPPPPPVFESPPTIQTQAPPPPVLDLGDEPVLVYSQERPEQGPAVREDAPARQYSEPERVTTAPPPPPSPTLLYTEPPAYPGDQGDDYTVKTGDTLGSIAGRHVPVNATLDQMMMALHRANPSAFINNNINRLRSGAILKIPSADEVQGSSHAEARREVRVHAREFNAWREQLAQDVAGRPARPADGGAGTRSIDAVPPPVEQDRDKVVIASGTPGRSGDAASVRALQEDLEAERSKLRESQARVAELAEITRSQEELLEVRRQQLAQLQTSQQQQQAAPPPPPPVVPEPPPAPVVEATPPPAPPVVEEEVIPPAPPVVEDTPVVSDLAPSEPAPDASAAIRTEQAFPDSEDGKDPFMEKVEGLLSDLRFWGGIALIFVGLAAFFGFRSWRNRRSDIGLDTLSQDVTSMFPGESTSIFGDNGGQSVDTSASSIIHTDFSQTGLSIDTNEGVDPVAEADVYMAYGRDSQAEEILNDALKADPKRGAIYVKLLEIYDQRQDLAQFEATASDLFSRTQGQGRDWEKAAQMGRRLDPSNPLYSGGSSRQENGRTSSLLPGLEPTLEEPSMMASGVPGMPSVSAASASSGTALSGLDFGTSPATNGPATNAGQLRDTVAMQDQMDSMMSSRITADVAPPSAPTAPVRRPRSTDAPTTKVDFHFEPAETTPKVAGSIDFDLGRSRTPSEAGKQPISVTVSRKPAAATLSRRPDSTALPKGAVDHLAEPLDFDLPVQGQAAASDMMRTVVLPSAQGGDARGDDVTLDLEKTGFDPSALDFDLDLDLKPDTAAAARAMQSSVPAGDQGGAVDDGEIDTRLELAMAYRDMGDSEGALELLNQVVAEGNATQRAEAKALIANLS